MILENWMEQLNAQLPEGAFLMVKGNPMTIGWAQFGVLWRRTVCTVYVRESRHTHTLLKDCDSFTLSVPEPGTMAKELMHCGTISGHAQDKVQVLGLDYTPARFGAQDGLAGCALHIECKILYRHNLDLSALNEQARQHAYPEGDPHTVYVGQVLGVYQGDLET